VTEGSAGVLVIDDDSLTRRVFRAVLEGAGYRVLDAEDGESALRLLDLHSVDVVLLDAFLPGMSGLEVLDALRTRTDTAVVPVVMVTAQEELAGRVAGLNAGANDYVVKPVDPEELVARVRAHVRARGEWSGAVEASLQSRIGVLRGLCNLRAQGSLDDVVEAICAELRRSRQVASAAIFLFTGPGRARLAGAFGLSGTPECLGDTVSAEVGSWLWSRVTAGPASLAAGSVRQPPRKSRQWATAVVPLGGAEHPFGALTLGLLDGFALDEFSELSTALDVAGAVSLLLEPLVRSEAADEGVRGRLATMLADHGYHMVFQPVVDLRGGRVVGYEALARFDDGTAPDTLVSLASSVGMGAAVEGALVQAAVAEAAMLPSDCWLAVNVSAGFAQSGPELGEMLSMLRRPAVVELTEHEPVTDYSRLRAALVSLPPGTTVAVDDAGAGYASFSHVLQLRPQLVKLDRAWVAGIDGDEVRQALVGAFVSFAERAGCQLVAEGIETHNELRTLEGLGVGLGQGYLLGRPAPLRNSRPSAASQQSAAAQQSAASQRTAAS
jgi:EAL domain-containing protein (putative c-di-GMP-specific phosphodiesterase class I)/DNA-binding response OmpR family regulator